MSDQVDTGFGDVLAGAPVWKPPEEASVAVQITAAVNPETPATSGDPESQPTLELSASLSPEGVQAAKSLVRLPTKSFVELARLARDVAMDIKELHVLLKEHGLDQAQYDFLEAHNEFYQHALKSAITDWHAPLSTQERIKVEAAAILEDSLIGLGARMQSKTEGLPGVIEAAKLFAKVAGVGEREAGGAAPGERFTINIDLGGDQKITVASGGPQDTITSPAPRSAIPTD